MFDSFLFFCTYFFVLQYFVPSFRRLGAKCGPSFIIPHILIGAKTDAQDLQLLGDLDVRAVINCAAQEVYTGAAYYQQPRAPWPEGHVRYDHSTSSIYPLIFYNCPWIILNNSHVDAFHVCFVQVHSIQLSRCSELSDRPTFFRDIWFYRKLSGTIAYLPTISYSSVVAPW